MRGLASRVSYWNKFTYGSVLATELLAVSALALWFFYARMSDGMATAAIVVPVVPACLAFVGAAIRQVYLQRANDAIIE
jgi:hypothetical protein